ncbi:calcium/sodium antiporter [Candidatus Saccharibacteria bacterium]|nr:calcium/sodium antiporter [Candidatus Saccharibacteria bacterium]
MALQVVLLIVGFVILIKGADFLIDGASSTASHFKVSKLLIGLTIVAFGTGAPELAVSISSMVNGTSDMLLGNVIGSNIVNILLLIGIGAAIRPIKIKRDTITKELPLLLLISVVLTVLFFDTVSGVDVNVISRTDGLICLACFAIFLFYIIAMARKNRKAAKEVEKPKFKLPIALLLVVLGLAGVVGGAELVVNSATNIATAFGVPERIIALTVVAFGTSLPELITTIKAARKNETELLVGNIIGSNIFNICIVLGLPAAIFGTIIPDNSDMVGLIVDMAMMVVAVVLLWIFARSGRKISRGEGFAMLGVFVAYYGYLVTTVVLKLTQG